LAPAAAAAPAPSPAPAPVAGAAAAAAPAPSPPPAPALAPAAAPAAPPTAAAAAATAATAPPPPAPPAAAEPPAAPPAPAAPARAGNLIEAIAEFEQATAELKASLEGRPRGLSEWRERVEQMENNIIEDTFRDLIEGRKLGRTPAGSPSWNRKAPTAEDIGHEISQLYKSLTRSPLLERPQFVNTVKLSLLHPKLRAGYGDYERGGVIRRALNSARSSIPMQDKSNFLLFYYILIEFGGSSRQDIATSLISHINANVIGLRKGFNQGASVMGRRLGQDGGKKQEIKLANELARKFKKQ
jgi:hypothetical protein